MILLWLIGMPVVAGAAAWYSARRGNDWPRWICAGTLAFELLVVLGLWIQLYPLFSLSGQDTWFLSVNRPWIPRLGIGLNLAMDGLSLLMVVLTLVLGLASVVCSWTEITERVGFFHFNLMATLAGILGVFLATDLILFYVFWEVMLVPMYFLIAVWGHEKRLYAAIKFFIFTQASGLLMLAAILGLSFIHGRQTGNFTFNYFELIGTTLSPRTSMLLMLGFFLAFAVKLPMVPFHTWLPDAHTEAPTAGSVILAGLLLKTGGYGLMRFVIPLFPQAAAQFATTAMILGVIGVLYGAILAFAQTDFKRLVAHTSVSHLGFVLIGVFAGNEIALQGTVMQMICHGVSTGALFILAGILQERLHSRDFSRMGGLWATSPRMGGMLLLFALASLGLPGLGNFIGEFLILLGTYQVNAWMAVPAAVGLVAAAVYSLSMVFWSFFGPRAAGVSIADLDLRETAMIGVMAVAIVWLGLLPQPVITTAAATVRTISSYGASIRTADAPGTVVGGAFVGRPERFGTSNPQKVVHR